MYLHKSEFSRYYARIIRLSSWIVETYLPNASITVIKRDKSIIEKTYGFQFNFVAKSWVTDEPAKLRQRLYSKGDQSCEIVWQTRLKRGCLVEQEGRFFAASQFINIQSEMNQWHMMENFEAYDEDEEEWI